MTKRQAIMSDSHALDRSPRGIVITVERALMGLAVLALLITLYSHATDHDAFKYWFAAEDGPAEWGTFAFLVLGFVLLLRKAARL